MEAPSNKLQANLSLSCIEEILTACRADFAALRKLEAESETTHTSTPATLSFIEGKGHVVLATRALSPGDVCVRESPVIEFPNITSAVDLDWLVTEHGYTEDEQGLLGYAFMQYSPDQINMLGV